GFAQLMQRMEQSFAENIAPSLANARQFRKRKQAISHEAQLLAMLAQVIQLAAYDYSDDETYVAYALGLRETCRELRRACDQGNYESARAAAGKVSQSCSACHADYRG
ncbi:MAG: cytochrome c, partial [Pirellulales bacterium]|nr:cytochrome c [Pirellulales bacterium]